LLTRKILGASFDVSNLLGAGFLEKVYENAIVWELTWRGIGVQQQAPMEILYNGVSVGHYYVADLIVEGSVVVELKCVKKLSEVHLAQVINYLKACDMRLGLLLNFLNSRIEWKRIANDF